MYLSNLTVHMFFLLAVGLFASIPKVDQWLTTTIYSLPTGQYSAAFSTYILPVNFVVCLWAAPNIGVYLYRYGVEMVLVNGLFKSLLDRPRPRDSLFLTGTTAFYAPLHGIRFTKNYRLNQSFPSGHVATIYLTYSLLTGTLATWYAVVLGLTFFARINAGAHHFSDCVWALIICQFFL